VTTNDSNIDLNDDSSSTASGPIYIRQPGFDYHAHEIVQHHQQTTQQQPLSSLISTSKQNLIANLKSFVINEPKSHRQAAAAGLNGKLDSAKKSKKSGGDASLSSLMKQANSTGSLPLDMNSQANKKAKKKLCMMLDGGIGINQSDLNSVLGGGEITSTPMTTTCGDTGIQLKPLSSKAKREPLPMRLRALPPSFWQQPNQPNVSPGTMYLPPLFKNDTTTSCFEATCGLDSDDSQLFDSLAQQLTGGNGAGSREVRISPANTDLLFKLFETAEQSSREKRQLHSQQIQLKLYRNNQRPMKSVGAKTTLLTSKGGAEDSSMVDTVSEGLFPLLRLDSRVGDNSAVNFLSFKSESGPSAMLSGLSSNGLSNSSPSISVNSTLAAINSINLNSSMSNGNSGSSYGITAGMCEQQNYAQALSEVVAAL
jgi:hypothetical protein